MVLYKDGKVYLKIVYWGMGGSGKTTILKTLYKITKESKKDIIPIGELQIIEKDSGATLYFDRGLFQSTKQKKVFYRVYTVAGQKGFSPLRRKIFAKTEDQTDAVILVIDSQTKFLEDNVESLLELKNMARNRLINEIPVIVMLNKQDLDDVIEVEDFKLVLKNEKLWFEPDNKLYIWNPLIYSSCALYEKQKEIYRSFHECARRTVLYHIYGDGKAPSEEEILDDSIVNI
ncbi:MAG: 50S ribosome-binding GTPase [Candidatus Lokiarchaeota archaeon]|nr:50S ribosome-binding GTPase [Candidatus Lokiarchaeota archaeon]